MCLVIRHAHLPEAGVRPLLRRLHSGMFATHMPDGDMHPLAVCCGVRVFDELRHIFDKLVCLNTATQHGKCAQCSVLIPYLPSTSHFLCFKTSTEVIEPCHCVAAVFQALCCVL